MVVYCAVAGNFKNIFFFRGARSTFLCHRCRHRRRANNTNKNMCTLCKTRSRTHNNVYRIYLPIYICICIGRYSAKKKRKFFLIVFSRVFVLLLLLLYGYSRRARNKLHILYTTRIIIILDKITASLLCLCVYMYIYAHIRTSDIKV